MTNRARRKGDTWERDFVELLQKNILNSKAKRIPGSGAFGTLIGEPILQGDIKAEFPGLNQTFRFEAKVGYGGSKQLTVKREWLNKIKEEAERTFSLSGLACKFSGAKEKDGIQYFIVLDFDTFCDIINRIGELEELALDGYD